MFVAAAMPLTGGISRYIWDDQSHGWLDSPAIGKSGGLLTTWDKQYYNHQSHTITKNWILFRGTTISTNMEFICINIYAPQEISEKAYIWEQLGSYIKAHEDIPICKMGDFNSVRNTEDREGCIHSTLDSNIFNSFILDNGLVNIETQIPHFTWFGPSKKKSTLDWILVNKSWFDTYIWRARLLSRKNSDHRPIRLGTSSTNWGLKPFKYFNSWLEDHTLNLMLTNIDASQLEGDGQLRTIIKNIRNVGKWWNTNVLGHLDTAIKNKEIKQDNNDNSNQNDSSTISSELATLYKHKHRDQMIWQKSIMQWIADGDRNTRYFHR